MRLFVCLILFYLKQNGNNILYFCKLWESNGAVLVLWKADTLYLFKQVLIRNRLSSGWQTPERWLYNKCWQQHNLNINHWGNKSSSCVEDVWSLKHIVHLCYFLISSESLFQKRRVIDDNTFFWLPYSYIIPYAHNSGLIQTLIWFCLYKVSKRCVFDLKIKF